VFHPQNSICEWHRENRTTSFCGREARYAVKHQTIHWLPMIILLVGEMIKEGARDQLGKQRQFVHSYREPLTRSPVTDVDPVERIP